VNLETALRYRLERAARELEQIVVRTKPDDRNGVDEVIRLGGKIAGVKLALSYLDEEVRMAAVGGQDA
jgi:hypothetical protein